MLAFLTVDPVVPVVVHSGTTYVLTPLMATMLTGLVLPFVVAFATKVSASATTKSIIGVVLAFVAAVVERATLADGTAVFTAGLLVDLGAVYVPQIVSYLGVYSHFNINAKIAPTVGLG